jgi:hypothetical protein
VLHRQEYYFRYGISSLVLQILVVFRELKFSVQVATFKNISSNIIFTFVVFIAVMMYIKQTILLIRTILYPKLLEHNAIIVGVLKHCFPHS